MTLVVVSASFEPGVDEEVGEGVVHFSREVTDLVRTTVTKRAHTSAVVETTQLVSQFLHSLAHLLHPMQPVGRSHIYPGMISSD